MLILQRLKKKCRSHCTYLNIFGKLLKSWKILKSNTQLKMDYTFKICDVKMVLKVGRKDYSLDSS